MRCEPWMDHKPIPRKTPLQRAEDDRKYWSREVLEAQRRLNECLKQFSDACTRIELARKAESSET